ncbi:MAG: phosphoglycerate kinase [Syntrophomonadaceae bacterium]|jgi:phosphoglycerate kinase|nr:phosphoglycerate kinase [Syntrophomonadaceae bacterium]
MRSIRDAEVKGKRVLMRVDFNVPTDKDNNIIDDTKIREALPTIEYVIQQRGCLILMSHLGRPKGKPDEKYSLKKVADRLSHLIHRPVAMAPAAIGPEVAAMVEKMQPGDVILLENVRFYPGEEKNDDEFSKALASLGDLYVNDAFGSAHRAHSSTTGVAHYLPAYAGLLMEKEVEMLRLVLEKGQQPRMAIMGGAKIADKLGLIDNLIDKMDIIAIGGGMANTFLKAQGIEVGRSLAEDDLLDEARRLLIKAESKGTALMLPEDVLIAAQIAADAAVQTVDVKDVPSDMMILDIGPKTVLKYQEAIATARTIIWNGPLGVYEYEPFSHGTREVARAVASSSALSVIGGGDSVAAVHDLGVEKGITHISTGGGASLEFLEGRELPGVAVCEAVPTA